MMSDVVDKAIKEGHKIVAWKARYSDSIWVGLGPEYSSFLSEAFHLNDSADIEALGFTEYLDDKGSWLPFANGKDLSSAIASLNKKLSELGSKQLKLGSSYWDAVLKAFEIIEKVQDGGYGIPRAIDSDVLPVGFDESN